MSSPRELGFRMPAEWEPQVAVLLAWPHENTPWAPHLEEVQCNYLEIIKTILKFQPVILITPDKIQSQLIRMNITSKKLALYEIS